MGSGFIIITVPEDRRCFGKLVLLNVAQRGFSETLGAATRSDTPENMVAS